MLDSVNCRRCVPCSGVAAAGDVARQALRHAAASIASPQQSPCGTGWLMLPMLSQGAGADDAMAVPTGPKTSQKARSAAMNGRSFMRRT